MTPTAIATATPTTKAKQIALHIADLDGNSLPGAIVEIKTVGSFISDTDGDVTVNDVPNTQPVKVSVRKDGFVFIPQDVTPGNFATIVPESTDGTNLSDCASKDLAAIRRKASDALTKLYMNAFAACDTAEKKAVQAKLADFVTQAKRYKLLIAKQLVKAQKAELEIPTASFKCPANHNCNTLALAKFVNSLQTSGKVLLEYTGHATQSLSLPELKMLSAAHSYLARARSQYKHLLSATEKFPNKAVTCSK